MLDAIQKKDFEGKIRRVRESLEAGSMDGALVRSWVNLYYLTAVRPAIQTRPIHFILSRNREYVLLVPNLIEETINREHQYVQTCQTYWKPEDLMVETEKIFRDLNLTKGKIGVEKETIPYVVLKTLADAFPQVDFVDIDETLKKIRMIKTEREIDFLREAMRVTDAVYKDLMENIIEAGKTEIQAANEVNISMYRHGAEGASFPPLILTGERSGLLSTMPSERKMEKGDEVLMDIGAVFNGYHTDTARMASIGPPSGKLKKAFEVERKVFEELLEYIKPGVKASDVYNRTMEALDKYGYRKYRRGERVGHGVGVEFHEMPHLGPYDHTILESNMVIAFEPTIQMTDLNCRIEDDLLITEEGNKPLTKFPWHLNIV